MIQLVVWGAGGRMGGRLIAAIQKQSRFRLAAAVDRPGHPAEGQDAGAFHGQAPTGVSIVSEPSAIDGPCVVVDFSLAGGPATAVRYAADHSFAFVSGTTALTDDDRHAIDCASGSIPVLTSPNFSLGIQLMINFAAKAGRILPQEFDAAILEVHHTQKKDKPSGTARAIATAVENNETPDRHIELAAFRLGLVTGEHTLRFESPFERIEISHSALQRDVFVEGALAAAAWLAGRPAGRYAFADVLERT